MLLTLILKGIAYQKFIASLDAQGISYRAINTRPTPFNTILWTANIDVGNAYLIGNYSFFDSKDIEFRSFSKNHALLGNLETNDKVTRLIDIAEGWFTITKKEGTIYFNDLRFGLISLDPNEERFVFSYKLTPSKNELIVKEMPRRPTDAKNLFSALWDRILGN